MLVNLKLLLKKARQEHFAIGSFNVYDETSFLGVIAASENLSAPVIISTSERMILEMGEIAIKNFIAKIKKRISASPLPIGLNLDHGKKIEVIQKCLEFGYPMVMYDGSELDLAENILHTQEIVRLAGGKGAMVEGEVGKIALGKYADLEEVEKFVIATQVDLVAAACGSAHGHLETENLNLELIGKIARRINIPLVLHGGSGLPDDQVKKAINLGVAKINIATDIKNVLAEEISDDVKVKKIQALVERKIELFGSENKG